jgi:hypothetical protein
MKTATTQAPKATDRLMTALSTVAALLDRTLNEVKSLDDDFQKRVAQAVLEAVAETKTAEPAASEAVRREVERIEKHIKEVAALIDDPATELSTVIRKSVERAELESYLRGIRFALEGK